ncbi:MAG TPA: two-component system response regulator CreB, partial [Rhodocyclaceae bacterium]|nr:two-component system response regulator CreB [Rhodocyclaceae bacterium]
GLPDVNGFDLCRQLRAFSEVPVIFLTARAGEIDRVVGLEIGADDYLTKPFSPRELVARIRVILRRSGKANGHPPPAAGGPFRLDPEQARIWFHNAPLDLTRYEYLLLKTLLAHPERIYSREQLLQLVWTAPEHSLDRTVDTHIKTLRAKLRGIDAGSDPIRTHRGLGYSLSLRP